MVPIGSQIVIGDILKRLLRSQDCNVLSQIVIGDILKWLLRSQDCNVLSVNENNTTLCRITSENTKVLNFDLSVMIHKSRQALRHLDHVIARQNRLLTSSSWKVLQTCHVPHGYDWVSTDMIGQRLSPLSVFSQWTHASGSPRYEVARQFATHST